MHDNWRSLFTLFFTFFAIILKETFDPTALYFQHSKGKSSRVRKSLLFKENLNPWFSFLFSNFLFCLKPLILYMTRFDFFWGFKYHQIDKTSCVYKVWQNLLLMLMVQCSWFINTYESRTFPLIYQWLNMSVKHLCQPNCHMSIMRHINLLSSQELLMLRIMLMLIHCALWDHVSSAEGLVSESLTDWLESIVASASGVSPPVQKQGAGYFFLYIYFWKVGASLWRQKHVI